MRPETPHSSVNRDPALSTGDPVKNVIGLGGHSAEPPGGMTHFDLQRGGFYWRRGQIVRFRRVGGHFAGIFRIKCLINATIFQLNCNINHHLGRIGTGFRRYPRPVTHAGAKPAALPFGILACQNCGILDRFFQRQIIIKIGNQVSGTNGAV